VPTRPAGFPPPVETPPAAARQLHLLAYELFRATPPHRGSTRRRGRLAAAARTVDSVGLAAGQVLRTSSVLRVGLLVYVVFLQFVAMVILYWDESAIEEADLAKTAAVVP